MKDLIFANDSGSLNVAFRVDLMNSSGQNFTVYSITGLDEDVNASDQDKAILGAFKRLPYNLGQFEQFAEDYGLSLTMADTDGSNSEQLVVWDSIVDSSWADSTLG